MWHYTDVGGTLASSWIPVSYTVVIIPVLGWVSIYALFHWISKFPSTSSQAIPSSRFQPPKDIIALGRCTLRFTTRRGSHYFKIPSRYLKFIFRIIYLIGSGCVGLFVLYLGHRIFNSLILPQLMYYFSLNERSVPVDDINGLVDPIPHLKKNHSAGSTLLVRQ
jgi:hypothetical protein